MTYSYAYWLERLFSVVVSGSSNLLIKQNKLHAMFSKAIVLVAHIIYDDLVTW